MKRFCKDCRDGDLLSPIKPYEVIDACELYNTPKCKKTITKMKKSIGNKHIVFHPNPRTLCSLKLALSGYEDSMELVVPIKVFIVKKKNEPFKMMLKHVPTKKVL
jgi:hypothetical protein